MFSFCLMINTRRISKLVNDSPIEMNLDDIERVWCDARTAIVEEKHVAADAEALADLRSSGARAAPHLRVPAFVAACALRLALADALPEPPVVTPTTQKEALALVRAAGRAWNQSVTVDWNAVAYAVCFAEHHQVRGAGPPLNPLAVALPRLG